MRILSSLSRLFAVLAALSITAPAGADEGGKAYLIEVEGAIGPAIQELVTRGIGDAEAGHAAMVILQMDTPGGLDYSMRKIIKTILDAQVPIVTWVSPQGSRAASAGTYILYASHVAAMAPATNLGAATPVQIGGLPKLPSPSSQPGEAKPVGDGKTDMQRKILNDAIAYIKGLARLRGRNEQWAEQAVREAASLSAEEALKLNVIDLVAADLDDLLKQLDGREINIKGRVVVLHTNAMVVERISPDWRSELLAIITNPNIAYVLMLIGIYGLIIEFTSPGAILPGVTGVISLLLALYSFQVLPVNYAALALLAVGIAFMAAEIFVTSGGVLGIGGVAAFTVGSIMLFDDAYLAVSIPMIGGTALIAGGFMLWILRRFAMLRRTQVVSGEEYMIGRIGTVREAFDARGRIDLDGENWIAETRFPLHAGQKVRVTAIDKLVLKVEPAEKSPEEE
ncbi:MAG TPA: nodulation protein NfeD [Gammaproteobacteria bacterium]|nr:nodulation protein NfeD [Gammaproteobacteria bacterium]